MTGPRYDHVKIINESFYPLRRATSGASGYDLHTILDLALLPGQRKKVSTGIKLAMAHVNMSAQVRPRSSGLLNRGLLVDVGTLDSDYRGEVFVAVMNVGSEVLMINRGDRIAQLVFQHVVHPDFVAVEDFDAIDATARGEGGFGSTGTHEIGSSIDIDEKAPPLDRPPPPAPAFIPKSRDRARTPGGVTDKMAAAIPERDRVEEMGGRDFFSAADADRQIAAEARWSEGEIVARTSNGATVKLTAPSLVTEPPPPKANGHPPSWYLVIVEAGGMDPSPVRELVVADMRARDDEGRRKYGVPLQPFNGRDSLVDAYQEALDLSVYLRNLQVEQDDSERVRLLFYKALDLVFELRGAILAREIAGLVKGR